MQIEKVDVKKDILGIEVIYENYTEAHLRCLKVEQVL